MTTPHDALFRHVFGDLEHAVPLLRSALPAELAAAIDWRTLRRLPEAQVDERLQSSLCDLLFEVRLGGTRLLLHVVLEHSSRAWRFTVLRMLGYTVRALRTWRREHRRGRSLPPVLPVVVYCGRSRWRAPTRLADLFDLAGLPAPLAAQLATVQPQLTILVDDCASRTEEDLRRRALSLVGLWAMAALQFLPPLAADPVGFGRWLRAWSDVTAAALLAETGQDAVDAVVFYILQQTKLDRRGLLIALRPHLEERVVEKFVSSYDLAIREGRMEASVDLVLRLLHARFGDQAEAHAWRIRAASLEQLQHWAERLLDARCIDDVFDET